MTTMDYAPYETDATCNQNNDGGIQSPVQQNPTVDVGVEMQGLKLALNTAQTGRTFQDRSHVLRVMARPMTDGGTTRTSLGAVPVKNVVVQGKRGNIVQTFPAVEYDFWPKTQEVQVGECIAFSWTGSNTHNNGNPAGDGQAGDAGEGRGGSDRSNLVQLLDKNSSFPMALDVNLQDIVADATQKLADAAAALPAETTNAVPQLAELANNAAQAIEAAKSKVKQFFLNSNVYETYSGLPVSTGNAGSSDTNPPTSERDAQVYFMSGGFYRRESEIASNRIEGNNNNGQNELDVLLNNAPATFRSMTVCPTEPGEYVLASSRNNNFSNRDQKLTIIVTPQAGN